MRTRFAMRSKTRSVTPNITIIEGTGASQLGIGIAVARTVEIVARDAQEIVAIASFQQRFGVTLSLPSQLGRSGVKRVLMPELAAGENTALAASADTLRRALASVGEPVVLRR